MMRRVAATVALLGAGAAPALAQASAPAVGGLFGQSLTGSALSLVIGLTVLSLAPGILMTVTSFVRIVVVLSLLRTGLGAPNVPPNVVVIALAMFMSLFVMQPTIDTAWQAGVSPYLEGKITEKIAFERTSAPFRAFMMKHTREPDLRLFIELSGKPVASREALPLPVLVPAFLISELKRAFEIGFLFLLPFLVIDLVVAAVLMALGLMMLPPATISLPAKLIFFVLVDGWALVAGSLVRSFGT
jgi:flagellar biosynthesis protein FliP